MGKASQGNVRIEKEILICPALSAPGTCSVEWIRDAFLAKGPLERLDDAVESLVVSCGFFHTFTVTVLAAFTEPILPFLALHFRPFKHFLNLIPSSLVGPVGGRGGVRHHYRFRATTRGS